MPNLPMPEGLDTPDLECVMLNLGPLPVLELAPDLLPEEELFFGTIPKLKYAQGAVAEKEAHVTLLFGIHPSPMYAEDVLEALGDWGPDDILIDEVSFFPSSIEGQDYTVIVAKVVPTSNLYIARKRLEKLPFTDRFADQYRPHVTLAYIKGSDRTVIKRWVDILGQHYNYSILTPTKLDLGV